jgi:hypothetical protein
MMHPKTEDDEEIEKELEAELRRVRDPHVKKRV